MEIKVSYPSGNVLHLSGEWKGPGNINGECIILILVDSKCIVPGITAHPSQLGFLNARHGQTTIIEKGSAFVGDPRGVYQDERTHKVLFNPRESMEGMNKWIIDWLTEHPEWPGILEL